MLFKVMFLLPIVSLSIKGFFYLFYIVLCFILMGIEIGTLHLPGSYCAAELHPQPLRSCTLNIRVNFAFVFIFISKK